MAAIISIPMAKITMHATDGAANAVTENLGYTDYNLLDSATQASVASVVAEFVHAVAAVTENNFVRTSITYEIPNLDVVIDS